MTSDFTSVFAGVEAVARAEEADVDQLCRKIGYGRVMQAASKLWQEHAAQQGRTGEGIVTGPHHSLTVPCVCQKTPNYDGGCDWCGCCGWLTKAVHSLVVEYERKRKKK